MSGDLDVLFVCTANQCRSPMAEALLRQRVPELRIASAGTRAVPATITAGARNALQRLGIALVGHESRRLDRAAVDGASLVLGLAREHVREAVVLQPTALEKVFTLKELVRRGTEIGRRRADESLADWLRRAGDGRSPADLLHSHPDDDVADPIGGPASGYEACARELVDLIDRLAELAFPA
jgi:protein-tyrosine phosphatase